MIDDISVIVLEFGRLEPTNNMSPPSLTINRKTIMQKSIRVVEPDEKDVMPIPRNSDPIRGSFVPADKRKKATRRDPTRGSTAQGSKESVASNIEEFIPQIVINQASDTEN